MMSRVVTWLVVTSLGTQLLGCTVAGYAVGRILDENIRAPVMADELQIGSAVRLELADGRVISGKIVRTGDAPQPWVTLTRPRRGALPGDVSQADTMRVERAMIRAATRPRVCFRPVLAVVGLGLDLSLIVWSAAMSGVSD
jgi:hypothetical protein